MLWPSSRSGFFGYAVQLCDGAVRQSVFCKLHNSMRENKEVQTSALANHSQKWLLPWVPSVMTLHMWDFHPSLPQSMTKSNECYYFSGQFEITVVIKIVSIL